MCTGTTSNGSLHPVAFVQYLREMSEMKRWRGCRETFAIVIKDKVQNGRKQDLEENSLDSAP